MEESKAQIVSEAVDLEQSGKRNTVDESLDIAICQALEEQKSVDPQII